MKYNYISLHKYYTMDNQRVKLITVKERLNNICQISHFRSPIHSFVWNFKQRIPYVIIGKLSFSAQNWGCDDNQKVIDLVEQILVKLNDPKFVGENSDLLSGDYHNFDQMFNLGPERDIIITKGSSETIDQRK